MTALIISDYLFVRPEGFSHLSLVLVLYEVTATKCSFYCLRPNEILKDEKEKWWAVVQHVQLVVELEEGHSCKPA